MTYTLTSENRRKNEMSWLLRLGMTVPIAVLKWRQQKSISSSLGSLSENALRDIGLTADDVEKAAKHSPFYAEPVDLGEIAKRQSKNW